MGTHPIFESDFDCLTEKKDKMSENINIGDGLLLTTTFGRFTGIVHQLDKMVKGGDFSLKMITVASAENPDECVPTHRFWQADIKNIEVIKRIKTSPEKITSQQWTVDNEPSQNGDAHKQSLKPHIKPKINFKKTQYELIDSEAKLQRNLVDLIGWKELGVAIEPLGAPRFINLSNGKRQLLLDTSRLAKHGLQGIMKKIFSSESRQKICVASHLVNAYLNEHFKVTMKNCIDIEVFGVTSLFHQSERSNTFRGYVSMVQTCLKISIPPPINTTTEITPESCSMMALRVEQLRALKTYLLKFMLEKTMATSNVMANLMIGNENDEEKAEILTRLDKYQLPRQLLLE